MPTVASQVTAGVRVGLTTGFATPTVVTTMQCLEIPMERAQKAVCVQPSVFVASTGRLLVSARALHSAALVAVLWASALLQMHVWIPVLGYP